MKHFQVVDIQRNMRKREQKQTSEQMNRAKQFHHFRFNSIMQNVQFNVHLPSLSASQDVVCSDRMCEIREFNQRVTNIHLNERFTTSHSVQSASSMHTFTVQRRKQVRRSY